MSICKILFNHLYNIEKTVHKGDMKPYFLYILLCQNGSYYTGITNNPNNRWKLHLSGKACRYTKAFPVKQMAALWEISESRSEAQSVESQVKKLSKMEKTALIQARKQCLFNKYKRSLHNSIGKD